MDLYTTLTHLHGESMQLDTHTYTIGSDGLLRNVPDSDAAALLQHAGQAWIPYTGQPAQQLRQLSESLNRRAFMRDPSSKAPKAPVAVQGPKERHGTVYTPAAQAPQRQWQIVNGVAYPVAPEGAMPPQFTGGHPAFPMHANLPQPAVDPNTAVIAADAAEQAARQPARRTSKAPV